MNIRAAKEDQSWLTYLLSEAVRGYTGQKIEFVEQGIEDEQYYRELGHHIRFVNEDMLIPLVGVHKDALQYETQEGQTIKEILMEKTEARSLEETNRSDDIGKYLLVVEKDKARMARRYIDQELREIYLEAPQSMRIPGFPCPRRASQPLRYIGTQNKAREEDVTPLEELASQTKMNWKTTRGVILVDSDKYPPLAKARKKSQWSTPKEAERDRRKSGEREKVMDIDKDIIELQCQIADEKLAATRTAKNMKKTCKIWKRGLHHS